MKQNNLIKRVFIAIAMILTVSVSASAHGFEVDGIYYNITSSFNKTCQVTYQGTSYSEYSNEYTGEIVIPESVTYNGITYSVTSIGFNAFQGCSGLTNVTIPNSVTSIGDDAFEGCSGLTSVTIPNSVTSIGSSAFEGCSGLTSVTIPNSVTSIGYMAFSGCSGLTSVTIPNSVTSIGYNAFYDCSGLTSVNIGNGVTSIGSSAFYYCSNLTSVNISDLEAWCKIDFSDYDSNPLYYAKNLYLNGELLTNIEIPNTITEIKQYAFSNCTGLKSVTIPNSVTSIGYMAFSGCSGLTSVTIPNSVTSIGSSAFLGCSGLTSVTIPESVTSIGSAAFYNCSGLTSVNIPNSVTSIGSSAFYNTGWYNNQPDGILYLDNCCLGYKGDEPTGELSLKDNTRLIAGYAFSGCSGLTSVTIPNGVTSIGNNAFSGCSGLTSVTIPNGVTSIGSAAFYNCNGLTSVNIPNSVTSIGSSAFYNTGWYNNQPDGILYLDNCCLGYKGDEPTGELSLKDNTRLIAGYAFYGCSGLTSVTIPNGVTSIGNNAFSGCSGLTSVTIPNGVTSIANYAFSSCYGLTSVTIPNSVTSIGKHAFSGCNNLTNIECKAKNPPTLGENVFSNYSVSLIIPLGSYSKYKEAEEWNKFIISDKYVMDNIYYTLLNESELTVVSKDTNYNSYSGEIVIPLEIAVDEVKYIVTQIGEKAFYNCSDLTSVTIPNSVTSIGSYAFSGCSGLTKVEITDINSWCKIHFGNETANPLYYAGKLYMDSTLVTDISIENIEEIKPYAFYNLTTLMNLSLDENVSKIGDKAFYGNKNIRSITCKASTPPTCGIDVFNSVKTEAVPLTVPQESVSLYQVADTWMDFWNITGSDFSGIDENLVDDTEEAEYYNLQGVKVVNPSSGIYIKKQGNKVTKVIL